MQERRVYRQNLAILIEYEVLKSGDKAISPIGRKYLRVTTPQQRNKMRQRKSGSRKTDTAFVYAGDSSPPTRYSVQSHVKGAADKEKFSPEYFWGACGKYKTARRAPALLLSVEKNTSKEILNKDLDMVPTEAGPQASSREKRLQYDKARRASLDLSLSDDQEDKHGYNDAAADDDDADIPIAAGISASQSRTRPRITVGMSLIDDPAVSAALIQPNADAIQNENNVGEERICETPIDNAPLDGVGGAGGQHNAEQNQSNADDQQHPVRPFADRYEDWALKAKDFTAVLAKTNRSTGRVSVSLKEGVDRVLVTSVRPPFHGRNTTKFMDLASLLGLLNREVEQMDTVLVHLAFNIQEKPDQEKEVPPVDDVFFEQLDVLPTAWIRQKSKAVEVLHEKVCSADQSLRILKEEVTQLMQDPAADDPDHFDMKQHLGQCDENFKDLERSLKDLRMYLYEAKVSTAEHARGFYPPSWIPDQQADV